VDRLITLVDSQPALVSLADALLAAVALAALVARRRRLAGTTLVAPWCWAVASMLSIAATEILVGTLGGPSAPKWGAPLRFAAAMSSYAPVMALFGAKRPQSRGWQFVVASLVAILGLPAARWALAGGVREIHAAWLSFLAILTIAGAANALGTRNWFPSLLVALAQAALVAPFLGWTDARAGAALGPLVALAALAAAHGLEALGLPRPAAARSPIDRLWRDFRDAFGLVWGLRVAERVNASATMYDWDILLAWHGFVDCHDGQPAAAVDEAAVETLRGLLRRFVSPEWIDERLFEPGSR
jgi:hypothetical protein